MRSYVLLVLFSSCLINSTDCLLFSKNNSTLFGSVPNAGFSSNKSIAEVLIDVRIVLNAAKKTGLRYGKRSDSRNSESEFVGKFDQKTREIANAALYPHIFAKRENDFEDLGKIAGFEVTPEQESYLLFLMKRQRELDAQSRSNPKSKKEEIPSKFKDLICFLIQRENGLKERRREMFLRQHHNQPPSFLRSRPGKRSADARLHDVFIP